MARDALCIYFTPSDGRNPGDISRHMHAIDAALHEGTGGEVAIMADPVNAAQFLAVLPPGIAEAAAQGLAVRLQDICDENARPVLEAWAGRTPSAISPLPKGPARP